MIWAICLTRLKPWGGHVVIRAVCANDPAWSMQIADGVQLIRVDRRGGWLTTGIAGARFRTKQDPMGFVAWNGFFASLRPHHRARAGWLGHRRPGP